MIYLAIIFSVIGIIASGSLLVRDIRCVDLRQIAVSGTLFIASAAIFCTSVALVLGA